MSGIVSEMWRGKSLVRTLANRHCQSVNLDGRGIDLGSGQGTPSHFRFFQYGPSYSLLRADVPSEGQNDVSIDLEGKLPFDDATFDFALMFWVIDYVYDQANCLAETARVLKPGAQFIGTSPWLTQRDTSLISWNRPSADGLKRLILESGFSSVEIRQLEVGPFSSAVNLTASIVPRPIFVPSLVAAFGLDRLVRRFVTGSRTRYPLGFWWRALR